MKDAFGGLIIAVFLLVLSVIFFWAGSETYDMVNNWIEGEGLVLSSVEYHNSDDEGNTFTSWICDISYTKEDGSQWIEEDVSCYLPASEGSYVDILYDPDSDGMKYGDRPDRSEIGVTYTLASVLAVISGAIFLYLGVALAREKIEAGRRTRQKQARLARVEEERARAERARQNALEQ